MGRKIQYYEHMAPKLGNTAGLTERRAQVLELVACGLTTEDIALKLGICEDTVKAHLDNLRRQFAAMNRVELIYQACAHGVLKCGRATFSRLFDLNCLNPSRPGSLEKYARWNPTQTRRSVGVSLGQKAVAPVFQEPATGEDDYLNIPTAQRRKILRMVENCRLTDAERLERYVREATQRFYAQEAAA